MSEAELHPEADGSGTAGEAYADRLIGIQTAWWKRALPVTAPWKWNVRRLHLGRTLDVGCGLGRNLEYLKGNGVGVDHNPEFVAYCRSRGLAAYTPDDFKASADGRLGSFDSFMMTHVLEHIDAAVADEILETYLPYVKPGGNVFLVTPQERGYRSDPTHIRFVQFEDIHALVEKHGLRVEKSFSFPFPRSMGETFIYNEFNVLARKA